MYDLLNGMRIVEGSAFVAAPLGGMTLAQLGADVIRFDQIGGGLDSKRWPVTAKGESLYWAGLNKGKRSFAVDLRSAEGQELVTALITAPGPDGGIFLTNLPVRGALGYEALRARRADVIAVNIVGTRDGAAQVDYTVNAAVGFPMVTGPAGHVGPVNQVLPAWDIATGYSAALAILAAERHRARKGTGQLVTIALLDIALAMAGALGYLSEVEVENVDRPRIGNHIFGTFGCDFPTKDGRHVMVCIFTKRHLDALGEATGTSQALALIERAKGINLADEAERYRCRDEIAALVRPWAAARALAEIRAAFDKAGCLWGPYQTFRQLVEEDPRCSPTHPMFQRLDQPGIGRYLVPGSPFDFRALARLPPKPAPRLGQHTEEILAGILRLPANEIARLFDAKVVAG
ncbi:MAG: 2-methylfumaryl-CoA isomerase [Alphaproteobacteria bacterium]|nr:2-methylfumaryl-CoA isomerase [Alphaproteobacteria bacterium]